MCSRSPSRLNCRFRSVSDSSGSSAFASVRSASSWSMSFPSKFSVDRSVHRENIPTSTSISTLRNVLQLRSRCVSPGHFQSTSLTRSSPSTRRKFSFRHRNFSAGRTSISCTAAPILVSPRLFPSRERYSRRGKKPTMSARLSVQ